MSDIEEVKSRLDIVDVVEQYVPLKRAGHSYKGLCPFHKEKTPSFVVTPSMQIYKCFGCGEGGDVLNFIQQIERVEFPEALKIAAEKAGYELKERSPQSQEFKKLKEKIFKANELAAKLWNYILLTHKTGKLGRDYLKRRKIEIRQVKDFQLGYAPKGTNVVPFLVKKGYKESELVNWGLAIDRKGKIIDKFRDRLVFPIWDMSGKIVGFSGRIVSPSKYDPKYLNSPETAVYKKGEILMGLHQAKEAIRKDRVVILQEGNIDLLSSHKVGVKNIAATGGTALTEKQMKLLKRYADTIYFAFDSDAAGTTALLKGLELAEKIGIKHKTISLGDHQDPDELINAESTLWQTVIEKPVNTVEHFTGLYQTDLDLGDPDDKSTFVRRMIPVLKALRDEVQRQHFATQVAMIVGVSTDAILKQLAGSKTPHGLKPKQSKSDTGSKTSSTVEEQQSPQAVFSQTNKREQYLLALLLQISNIENLDITAEIFADVNCREIYSKLNQAGNADINFGVLADELSDGGAEVLQQVLSIDLTGIHNFKQEFNRVYRTMYASHVRGKVLDLRRTLAVHPDDENALRELQHYGQELKSLV